MAISLKEVFMNPEDKEDMIKYIGDKIREQIEEIRNEAHSMLKKAKDIEEAWSEWDLSFLSDYRVLTPRDIDFIKSLRQDDLDRLYW